MDRITQRFLVFTAAILMLMTATPISGSEWGTNREECDGGTRGNIIVVNASGGGDYTHIQWAVDNASDGDTVFVEAGTYYENIEINKTISLIGADRNNTIIVGIEMTNAIRINADGVIVSGFYINNTDSEYNCSLNLFCADNCRIENVIVSNSYIGILLWGSENNTIINIIARENRYGIYLDYAENTTIVHNTCSDNKNGINVVFSERNVIDKNIVKNNDEGIRIDSSANNTVSNNTASFNKRSGITVTTMASFLMSDDSYERYKTRYNQIIDNFCESNMESGITLRTDSNYNNVRHNTCIFNSKSGISVSGSDQCIIELNNCISNTFGIYLSYSINSTIRNNICLSNQGFGIVLNTSCENNTVYANDLLQNNFGKDQGADNGTNNSWNLSHFGNYWSDWTSPDSNNDFIVDLPYNIFGSANSTDFFPLVEPANQLIPIADAGPDYTIDQHDTALFNGSLSYDNVGIVNYTWSFLYRGEEMHIYGVTTSYIFDDAGLFEVVLNVSNAEGNWAVDTLNITVKDTTPPIAYAGSDITINQSDTIEFFFHQNSSDNVGCWNWTWTFEYNGTTQTLFHSIPMSSLPFFKFDIPGDYSVTMTVCDEAGNQGTDILNITVLAIFSPNETEIDSDGDGWNNTYEQLADTDPYDPLSYPSSGGDSTSNDSEKDSDNDTYNDTYELSQGSDPYNPLSTPLDWDGDGVPNGDDAYPRDPKRWKDEGRSVFIILGIVVLISVVIPAGLAAYTRIKQKKILDNDTRHNLYAYINHNPGRHFTNIKKHMKVSQGTLTHHIRFLTDAGLIRAEPKGNFKFYYPTWMKDTEKALTPVQREIMDLMETRPGIEISELAEKLGRESRTVRYHLNNLRDLGMVRSENIAKRTCWFPEEDGKGKLTR